MTNERNKTEMENKNEGMEQYKKWNERNETVEKNKGNVTITENKGDDEK